MKSEHSNSSERIELTTYDPAKARIPICWKCYNRIVGEIVNDQLISLIPATVLIGCKEQASIKNYEDAKRLCPLLFPSDQQTIGAIS
jgi:hypothetical protein